MSDVNFVTDGTIERVCSRQQQYQDILRESFRQQLKHVANDVEKATDYCRHMKLVGADVTEELKELETTAHGLLLVAGLLKLEQERE